MKRSNRIFIGMVVLLAACVPGLAGSFGSSGEPKIDELIRTLDTRHWETAVEGLGGIGVPAVESLIRLLNRDEGWPSARASYALVKIRSGAALDAVIGALRDVGFSSRVRGNAAQALGAVKSDRVITVLIDILGHDSHWAIRMWAARSLGQIGSDRAADALLAALHDESEYVRGDAAAALGRIRPEQAAEILVDTLRD